MKKLLMLIFLFCTPLILSAQRRPVENFSRMVRELDSLMCIHCGAKASLQLSKVIEADRKLNFYFTGSIAEFPLRKGDEQWIKKCIADLMPEQYSGRKVGNIFCGNRKLSAFYVSDPGSDGRNAATNMRIKDRKAPQLTRNSIQAPKGLEGRHIGIWQSHGMYFDVTENRWMWQRAVLFQTVEDLFTQSFVVPFIVPMLENAGANALLPRERDWHTEEIIIDNDGHENTSQRIHGKVAFNGKWQKTEVGFADTRDVYIDEQTPFTEGSAMKCFCGSGKEMTAEWTADIPVRGEYAVYVTYPSFPESSTAARYTVHAFGSDKTVLVNQKMGGRTWIYLGTYEFDKGERKLITLSNRSSTGSVVAADAVRIGGGMGNIARARKDSLDYSLSGMPRFAEGARYYMQWNGIPVGIWSQNEAKNDYRDDLMSRGKWVEYLSGGSWVNPEGKGLNIPIDLTLALHSDAGKRDNNGILGTLAIYTLLCDGSSRLPNGESRQTCRELTDFTQTQVSSDIRAQFDSLWVRRQIWNRSYSESRTTSTPATLLEILSHQNFEDMKYGLDPQFRFCVARACYKAILKYLAMRYGFRYAVQPLPVHAFSARISRDRTSVELCWKESVDSLEKTASPSSFIVYRRTDDGGWDNGIHLKADVDSKGRFCHTMAIEPGHIYSFRVVAVNDGGHSFPSETLAVGMPDNTSSDKVLIVNNFKRISAPTWFDTPLLAGFDDGTDSGVPYIRDWKFTGVQREFRRSAEYINDSSPGFGHSCSDYAGKVVAGNSFDYPYLHGKSIMKTGFSFESVSSEAYVDEGSDGCFAIDLICGKECRVRTGMRSPVRGGVFTPAIRKAVRKSVSAGCNILISGSYIAHECYGDVYPESGTATERAESREFISNVLGYTLHRSYASKTGKVRAIDGSTGTLSYPVRPCAESYCVESPDALGAFHLGGEVYMNYEDTHLPAAVRTRFTTYKTAAFGFPLEIIRSEEGRDRIFAETLKYFKR